MASQANTPSIPTTMRAWAHYTSGLPREVLHLTPNLPIPELKADEVLIKVSYAALNPGGPAIMNLMPMIFRTKPSIPEMDFAGTIIQFSSSVPTERDLNIGSRVFGNIPAGLHFTKGRGALAEYVVLPVDRIVAIPENMKDEEAAGLGIVGCSALALLDRANPKEGDSVLINGASGGIGTLLVQMAKEVVGEKGKVVALCSGKNVDVVKSLGADEVRNLSVQEEWIADEIQVIDYQKHDPVHKYLAEQYGNNQFDCIIDSIGINDLWVHCEPYLKPGKPFITIAISVPSYTWSSFLWMVRKIMSNTFKPKFLGGVNRPYAQQNGIANLEAMKRLARMVEEGKLKVLTDSIWSFDDVLLVGAVDDFGSWWCMLTYLLGL
jgi:NADPH:quinone reductase-like Zn-dependent oxidoreductase